jgi:hypothetical protein
VILKVTLVEKKFTEENGDFEPNRCKECMSPSLCNSCSLGGEEKGLILDVISNEFFRFFKVEMRGENSKYCVVCFTSFFDCRCSLLGSNGCVWEIGALGCT